MLKLKSEIDKSLEGKIVGLDYCAGPGKSGDYGAEDALTLWKVENGRLVNYHHVDEFDYFDEDNLLNTLIEYLKSKNITTIYTISHDKYRENLSNLSWSREDSEVDGEITEWGEYSQIGQNNLQILKEEGIEVIEL
jgi:hypothetical protein